MMDGPIEVLLASVFGERFRDLRGEMMVHPTLRYAARPMSAVTGLVVHHTAARADAGWPAVARYHVQSNGWPGIAYHFGIEPDGVVSYLGDVATVRYHARQANGWSIGICCAGDYSKTDPPGGMVEVLGVLLNALEAWLGLRQAQPAAQPTVQRLGHRDVVETTCPGDRLYAVIPKREVRGEPLPEDEPDAAAAVLAEKVRWWLEECIRQMDAGQELRADAILQSLVRRDGGLLYRLENTLKEAR